MILNTTTDKPWSQYFCCILVGNREFVRDHPIATSASCVPFSKPPTSAREPERAAQLLVDAGFTERYDYALQTLTELPYATLA